ncbi:MAG TPA: zf-HC2 domain-containing protein [Bryobacteraceae bacterium]|jgi:anti-sigma factor RsiW|nr:zf-HC2 domain-containing protein [Bryobacteraceae bacterium]
MIDKNICPLTNENTATALLDYSAGKLDALETATIEAHLESCPDCKAFVSAQKELWTSLDLWQAPAVSDGFDQRLYARIAEESKATWFERALQQIREPFAAFSWAKAMPVAAACAVLAGALLLYTPRTQTSQPPATKAGAVPLESVDLDQVERALDDLDMLRQLPPVSKPEQL